LSVAGLQKLGAQRALNQVQAPGLGLVDVKHTGKPH